MEQLNNLRILVIDDNPEIHKDFIKILTRNTTKSSFDEIGQQLFGTTSKRITLPEFVIDTVSRFKQFEALHPDLF